MTKWRKKSSMKKNKSKKKKRPFRICEQCGNGGFTDKTVYKCKYCGYMNGLGNEVLITRGSINDR